MTNKNPDQIIEKVKILDSTFYFMYDYGADVTVDEFFTTENLDELIAYCVENNLTWEWLKKYEQE